MVDPRVGEYLIGLHQSSLPWGVKKLVADVKQQDLLKLKVRSGEHLAAILCTAYFGSAPIAVDADGGVDLVYRGHFLSDLPNPPLSLPKTSSFEIKSMSGKFREYDARVSRAVERDEAADLETYAVAVESAESVLARAQCLLAAATSQLRRKALPDSSKNVFLVVHPLDAFALEIMRDPPISAHLPKLHLDRSIPYGYCGSRII